jgi:response regulator RpfG family c-di-GMP phosphodiesterase
MNETSKINKYIIEDFSSNDLVNTVSIVPTNEMDLNKENIYPLVNVDMTDADVQDDAIIFEFIITALEQREIKSQKTDSKLLSDSNYLDNINETLSIAQKFVNKLRRLNNDENIEIDALSTMDFLKEFRGAGLDGVQFTINLSIPNEDTAC